MACYPSFIHRNSSQVQIDQLSRRGYKFLSNSKNGCSWWRLTLATGFMDAKVDNFGGVVIEHVSLAK